MAQRKCYISALQIKTLAVLGHLQACYLYHFIQPSQQPIMIYSRFTDEEIKAQAREWQSWDVSRVLNHHPGLQLWAEQAWPLCALCQYQTGDGSEWEMSLIHICSAGKTPYSWLIHAASILCHLSCAESRGGHCRQTSDVRHLLCIGAAVSQAGKPMGMSSLSVLFSLGSLPTPLWRVQPAQGSPRAAIPDIPE